METPTLHSLFFSSCKNATNMNCALFVDENNSKYVKYAEMENTVINISNILISIGLADSYEFVGIVADELCTEVIALLIGIMNTNNAFVFLDSHSTNTIGTAEMNLDVRWFICKEGVSVNSSFYTVHKFLVLDTYFEIQKWKCDIIEITLTKKFVHFAFAVFSSGSTGTPKVIKVPHQSIVPNILDLRKTFEMQSSDVVYVSTPLTFDPCVVDIFLALSSGASLLLLSNRIKFDPTYISKMFSLAYFKVTVLYLTPSVFMKWFPKEDNCSSLRILVLGGEAFPKLKFDSWAFARHVKIYNIYGITEVSCWATLHLVNSFTAENTPIGDSLSETILQVKSEQGIISDGVGELYIGSNRRICIVNDDFETLEQIPCFRATGDLVEFVNGNLCYVGRKDRRIKLYGHQIDLSVIEIHILRIPGVDCCCCIFVEEESKIVALVELTTESNLSVNELEKLLRRKLPPIMVPSSTYILKIPLNKHGKTCISSCKKLYSEMKSQLKNVSDQFHNLWRKFTFEKFDLDTDSSKGFIQLGGNSILALQFATTLSDAFPELNSEFIALLLSDKSYSDCFNFVQDNLCNILQSSTIKLTTVATRNKSPVKNIENFRSIQPARKINLNNFGEVIQVMNKGKIKKFQETIVADVDFRQRKLEVLWKWNLEKCVDASPTLLIFGSNEAVVVCGSHSGKLVLLHVQSGAVLLSIVLPDRIESSAAISSCGRCIYIGCYDKRLYCIDIINSCIRWYFQTNDIVKCTPVEYNDNVFFGSYDHTFYCVQRMTGSMLWKLNIDKSSIYATPLLCEKIVLATLGGSVAFVDHTGRIEKINFYGKPFFSSPCEVPKKDMCILIDVTGIMRIFTISTGSQMYQYQVNGNVFSSVTVNADCEDLRIIFGCHDKHVYSFKVNENNITPDWKLEVDAAVYSTPFTFNNKFGIYVASVTISGHIYVSDAKNGKIILAYSIDEPVFSSPVVYRDNLIVGCRDNYLYCFKFS